MILGSAFLIVTLHNGFEGLAFLLLLIFGLVIFCFLFWKINKVHIDDHYLYVDNFKKSIKIPLSNIKRVDDIILFSPRRIIVHFKKTTEFGNKIMFIGYTEVLLFFATHPAVKEIRFRLEQKQKKKIRKE